MSHPRGKHISTSENHELDYWLEKQGFRKTENNRDLLKSLIGAAKLCRDKKENEHLEHTVLDEYFDVTKEIWRFEIKDKKK